MILVNKIVNSLLDENTYIVYDTGSKQSLIIDPGSDFSKIETFIKENNLIVLAVFLTHGHFDHTFSCKKLQDCGYKIYIHYLDEKMCTDERSSLAYMCNIDFETFLPDYLLDKETILKIGDFNIQIVSCPGHSRGGLAYVVDKYLFSGDTMFFNGYGRTDFDGGSVSQLTSSIKKLKELMSSGLILYPGHNY